MHAGLAGDVMVPIECDRPGASSSYRATPHFHWARSGEYVSQVTAIGPLGLDYLDPKDDPRSQP
jgi:hypothetical protein